MFTVRKIVTSFKAIQPSVLTIFFSEIFIKLVNEVLH